VKFIQNPRTLRRLGLAAACLCTFGLFFALGYFLPGVSFNDALTVTSFTSEEEEQILSEIQANFSETISYQQAEASDLITNDDGVSYYTVTYYVCLPNADQVYVYLYYKFVTDSEDYQAGDIVCMMHMISPTLAKADVFPNGV
jgi:hypothetical protein